MADLLSFKNPVFSYFAFHAGAVVLKTVSMSIITALNRVTRNVYANPEDTKLAFGAQFKDKPCVPTTHPTIERIRRCHLNDLENVVPFVLLGFLYVLTEPDLECAMLYFRLFTASRFLHTVSYLLPLPQPSRALCFGGGFFINCIMAVAVLKKGTF